MKINQTPSPASPTSGGTRPAAAESAPTAISTKDTLSAPGVESESARLARMKTNLAKVIEQGKAGKVTHSVSHRFRLLLALYNPKWLFATAENQPPRESSGPLDKLTRTPDGFAPKGSTPESRLITALLAAKGPLEPADVMKMSLQANGNNYFLASLTAENVLKNATCTDRRLRDKRPVPADIAQQDQAIVDKLVNLRAPNSPDHSDKMGPWYHMFGLATWDAGNQWAMGSHTHWIDEAADKVEHAHLFSRGFWKGVSGVLSHVGLGRIGRALVSHSPLTGADPEKAQTDQSAVDAFKIADQSGDA